MATAHLIRLIIIVTVFPFFVNSFYDAEITNIQNTLQVDQNLIELLYLVGLSIILIILFDKIKIPS